ALAQAGLTHVHLLPIFDIATINEDPSQRQEPSVDELSAFPGDSEEQQALINPLRDLDAFNWGYDPFHYTVPEGSYSTNPDGRTRIIEFRAAVQALNSIGLRVVMDVVYNHTNSSGQADRSVLDRIVPGYYHRLNANGGVETSTCCQNTATEHNMMERLMVDSVVTWARDYRVDGFRFDLMGHHMLDNMVAVRNALDALTLENDGVDGQAVYVYGEGWNFGEVADNARGIQASQLNLGGTGIGSFNDRLRDGARGGPFENQQAQQFLTGLYFTPNGVTEGDADAQLARLLHDEDLIRIGLAGNLRDYVLVNAAGESVTGAEIDYNGSPAGYTLDPQENIIYISAHDNLTIWDRIMLAAPAEASIADRVRMNNVGHSIVALSQGVPFFHAGDELLRSKSGDGNSYNSGDWFNRLDFTYQFNNWAVGLPIDRNNWEPLRGLLGNPDMMVTHDDIMASLSNFEEMLQIRRSSPLFRLQTAQDVMDHVSFLNTGPDQQPGVIVYVLSDTVEGADLDPNYQMVVVIFNASPDAITFSDESLAAMSFELHPILQNSQDAIVQTAAFADGAFTVPGRTTAVFVVPQ
ncbi:MAG: pullulanase-type alpha-1,6-glucosidase, partial [Anaerolineae bacterium]